MARVAGLKASTLARDSSLLPLLRTCWVAPGPSLTEGLGASRSEALNGSAPGTQDDSSGGSDGAPRRENVTPETYELDRQARNLPRLPKQPETSQPRFSVQSEREDKSEAETEAA